MPNKKVVFKTPWFEIESEEFKSIPALKGKPVYRLNVPDSVAIAVFTKDKKLVMVRQFRPVIKKVMLEIPAGGVGKSESPHQAAKRELLEETGYVCRNLKLVGRVLVAADRIKNNIYVFWGQGATRKKKFIKEDGVEVLTLSLENLKKFVKKNEFQQVGGLGTLLFIKWKLDPRLLKSL